MSRKSEKAINVFRQAMRDHIRFILISLAFISTLSTGFFHLAKSGALFSISENAKIFCDIAITIFTTMLAASMISGLFELYFRDRFIDASNAQLNPLFKEHISKFANSQYSGVLNVYSSFDEAADELGIYKKISTASEVLILQTWIPNIINLRPSLERMIKNNGKLRAICLREGGQLAHNRAQYISKKSIDQIFDTKKFQYDCAKAADNGIKLSKDQIVEISDKDNVKEIDIFPAFSIYVIDNFIILGHFMLYSNSMHSMQLHIDRNSEYGKQIIDYFENLWNISKQS